jgi:Tol biopolymer transport system component
VIGSNGSGLTTLTQDPQQQDRYPAWSPDGSLIAFASDRDGDYEIFVMNADGSGVSQLTFNSADDYYPVWSPDGTQIAYHSASTMGAMADIYIVNVDGSGSFNLSDDGSQDRFPDWKP